MDHWGDPWADNANDKSPPKNAVTSPLPPSFTFTSVPLNGFAGDAGWGNNDDDGFGDWTTSDIGNTASTDVVSTAPGGADPGSARWDVAGHEEGEEEALKWPATTSSPPPQELEKVNSEPSDSSTVSELERTVDQDTIEEPPQTQTDIESSIRSSTSPSETSRKELPVESPRTSVEDERILRKDVPSSEPLVITADAPLTEVRAESNVTTREEEGHVGEDRVLESSAEEAAGTNDTILASPDSSGSQNILHVAGDLDKPPEGATAGDSVQAHTEPKKFVCDTAFLAQLFPLGEQTEKQLDEHNDPIFSTSARKAWYRLTRKQTMREFNHGDNDDNYIRVTWTNSHVRTEAHKVVSRWAREDRISGTGPGARASFYWDTPAPAEHKAPFGHARTQSSVPLTKTALPARQSLPPRAMNQSAAFDWSTSASADPWKLESPSQRSTSTSPAPKHPTVAKLQRQEGRASSVDLTPRRSDQVTHKRTATVSDASTNIKTVAEPVMPLTTNPSAVVVDSRADFSKFDGPSISTSKVNDDLVDDDEDDWGEMVQTPTLPTAQQLDPFSRPLEPEAAPSAPPIIGPPPNTNPVEPVSAAPVVRLQSIISPTSALFKANTFIPLNAEQGPIGPGLLKPANRSNRAVPKGNPGTGIHKSLDAESLSSPALATLLAAENGDNSQSSTGTKSDSVPSSLAPELAVHTTTEAASITAIAQPASPAKASADSWADADFSIFESSAPAPAMQQPPRAQDSSDPFSFFDTPDPSSESRTSKSFSRSSPHNSTPPTSQPLASSTSSQQRKAEEDELINSIIDGLPDLSYMLRQ